MPRSAKGVTDQGWCRTCWLDDNEIEPRVNAENAEQGGRGESIL